MPSRSNPSSAIIVPFRCRSDNVGVLLHDPATGATAAIDAPETAPILEVLGERNWRLTDILVTHHHGDHTAGIADLKARFGCRVTGPRAESTKIAGLDVLVAGGDRVTVGALAADVIDLPGHTLGHIGFHFAGDATIFVGDTLFENGCGRLLEGTAAQMWSSLGKLMALPDATQVFFGHDYSIGNGRFAIGIDPGNDRLAATYAEALADGENGRFRHHTTMAREKATNPFLRAGRPDIAAAVGLAGAAPVEVFAELRERKNRG